MIIPPFPFVRLTDDELSTLATDIRNGLVFTSDKITSREELEGVFGESVKPVSLWAERIGLLYAYKSKALKNTFRGLPTFDHVSVLVLEDLPKLKELLA